MTAELIFHFLDQKTEDVILAKHNGEIDWAAGYQCALQQLRNFVSAAVEDSRTTEPTTIDLLNDAPFLEIMNRAINLCAAAEAVLFCLPKNEAAALGDAASQFRNWFEGKYC